MQSHAQAAHTRDLDSALPAARNIPAACRGEQVRRAQAGSGIVDIDGLRQGSVVHAEAGHHTRGPCVRIVVRGWQVSRGAISTQAVMDGAPQCS